jgi:hypothetical protein
MIHFTNVEFDRKLCWKCLAFCREETKVKLRHFDKKNNAWFSEYVDPRLTELSKQKTTTKMTTAATTIQQQQQQDR